MTKEELKNLRNVDHKIDSKLRQLEELKSKKYLVRSFDYSKDKVQTSCKENSSENLIIKICDLENEINSDIDKLVDMKAKAKTEIDAVGGIYGVILQMRYLENKDWAEISERFNYDVRHIFRLHGEALKMISTKRCQ